jgi:hypothetical protein
MSSAATVPAFAIHIAGGTVGLIARVVAVAARKGGPLGLPRLSPHSVSIPELYRFSASSPAWGSWSSGWSACVSSAGIIQARNSNPLEAETPPAPRDITGAVA